MLNHKEISTINPVIKEAIEYLESWDVEPTMDLIKNTIIKWIANLYSHIGIAAHMQSCNSGVEDETGMSWIEQDMQMLKQIEEYNNCLAEMGIDPNEIISVIEKIWNKS